MNLKEMIKGIPGISIAKKLRETYFRFFGKHDDNDNSGYWRTRAKSKGSEAVLWKNAFYNEFVREREFSIILPYLNLLSPQSKVLDIGCGIGHVTSWILAKRPDLFVTAVDFPEMIARAKIENATISNVEWICSSADEYEKKSDYDFVLSSACYSMIRKKEKCIKAISNGCNAVKSGGLVFMADPFHSSKYLARVKMSDKEVIQLVKSFGFELIHHSGMLFWPFREILANSSLPKSRIAFWFQMGEKCLNLFGKRIWSDYKILVFRKLA